MFGLILAAGLGTRLGAITQKIPKCLVVVEDKPILLDWIEKLDAVGCAPIYINVHHKKEMVLSFLDSIESRLRQNIVVLYEEPLLGTAGSIRRVIEQENSSQLAKPMLVTHADNYLMGSIASFTEYFREELNSRGFLMGTFFTNEITQCGIVEIDSHNKVVSYVEKPKHSQSNLANAAIYLFDVETQNLIASQFPRSFDFAKEVIPSLVGKIHSYLLPHPLVDIGTPERLILAKSLFERLNDEL